MPALARHTLPMDALEGTIWGHQLEWGYDKNPFLNGWLTRLALELGGSSGWLTYFFCQVSVGLCFWAVWQLAKKMVAPFYALIAVLLLEGMQYYNLHAIDFNDNTLELSTWALTILFFYHGVTTGKLRDWLLTGLFAGLAMMAKYFTAMLLVPMLFFLVLDKTARQQFKNKNLYWGCVVFCAVITPHVLWLFQHDFVTVNYALDRVSSESSWVNRILFPLQFSWQQLEVIMPTLLLFSMLLIGKKPVFAARTISSFNQRFLFLVGLAPFLLTVLLSAAFEMKLRAGWGQPFFSLLGIMLVAWLPPVITREKLRAFVILWVSLFSIMLVVYSASLIRAKEPSSANFPGRVIAEELTQQWQAQYHTALQFVAGPRWLAGNVALYSADHPAVYMDWDKKVSPWIDEAQLKKHGAIFVWDPTEAVQVDEAEIRARFPALGKMQVGQFHWLRNDKAKPVVMSYAFLPPENE